MPPGVRLFHEATAENAPRAVAQRAAKIPPPQNEQLLIFVFDSDTGRTTEERLMWMWAGVAYLGCLAMFLELAARAPDAGLDEQS